MANIFVIDDEQLLLSLISTTLRLDGHNVTAFQDPLSLVEADGHLPIDLLLTDVEMKPINGFEVVKRLNLRGFTGPVLFMSGYSYPPSAISGIIGRRTVIEKPFTSGQLRAAVSEALTNARTA
jgi:DNA-binding NtrC family response regulator